MVIEECCILVPDPSTRMRVRALKIERGGTGEDSSRPNELVSFCRTLQVGSEVSAFVQHTSPQESAENSLAPAAATISHANPACPGSRRFFCSSYRGKRQGFDLHPCEAPEEIGSRRNIQRFA